MAKTGSTSDRVMAHHLERIRRSGKIEEAALVDFNGAIIASSSGMILSTAETSVIVHALESKYKSLTKLTVGTKTFTCFRCDICCPAIIGRSENDIISIYKSCDFIVVAVSDPESPGSCIYEMTKFVRRYNRQSSIIVSKDDEAEAHGEIVHKSLDPREQNNTSPNDGSITDTRNNDQEAPRTKTLIHPSDYDFKLAQKESYSDIEMLDESASSVARAEDNDADLSNEEDDDSEGTLNDVDMNEIVKDVVQAKHGEVNVAFEEDEVVDDDDTEVNTDYSKEDDTSEATARDLHDIALDADEVSESNIASHDHAGKRVHRHENHVRFSMEIDEYTAKVTYDEVDQEAYI